MKDFRKLKVWEKAHRLTVDVYRASARFPRSELFGLTSQIRRAAASVPSNIAEGCGRRTDAELARLSEIAMGSASELEYQLLLAADLEYLNERDSPGLSTDVIEVKRMLGGLIRELSQPGRRTVRAPG